MNKYPPLPTLIQAVTTFAFLTVLHPVNLSAQATICQSGRPIDFSPIHSPVIFPGDATTAYRDPAAVYSNGWFYVYFSLVKIEELNRAYSYTAWSKSCDLVHWSEPKIFTPRDLKLNYSSPGNVVRYEDEWILCLQTYPRPKGEKFGNENSRVWTMRSKDLENWGQAELLAVKGSDVTESKMGRLIDPFLLEDKDERGKWWCFFKEKGAVHLSWSHDLKTWTYSADSIAGGENPCVIVDGTDYVLYYSPGNGIGVKRSPDLKTWRNEATLTLGQKDWPWTRGRLTAGFVLDLRKDPKVGKALMFFHGSTYGEGDPRGGFDNFASLGIAWSYPISRTGSGQEIRNERISNQEKHLD